MLVTVCLLLPEASAGADAHQTVQMHSFPQEQVTVFSPNGRFALRDQETGDIDQPHRLVVSEVSSGREQNLMGFSRHVDVAWSSGSDWLAVSDYAGSNFATCLLFSVEGNSQPIDIRHELTRVQAATGIIEGNHHVYVTCSRWVTPDIVKVKLDAYGDHDPAGSVTWYTFQTGGQVLPSTGD
jgi:hypothetical protein